MTNRTTLASPWKRFGRALAVAAVPASFLSWSGTASAQGWLADRRYTEGAGIKTGDFELHPGIGGEVGYDSNWFLRSHKEGPNIVNGPPALPAEGAAIIRVTPSFYVSTLGQQRLQDGTGTRVEPRVITFRGGASATLRGFIGDSQFNKQHNVSVASDFRMDVNQSRPLGFAVFGGYNRLIQPQVLANPNLSFNRSDLRGGAEIIGIPGGGTLDLRGGYQIHASLFEETQGVPYTNITHEVYFKDRWKFRPRTALFHDTSLRFINYPNAERATNYLNDSTPLRTRLGVTGLVTERVGLLLAAGYGATFFKNPGAASSTQYDSVNGQAEATFHLGQGAGSDEPGQATLLLSTFSLGVLRDFQNSLLGNFYNVNRAYAKLEYWFGGRTVLRLDAYGEQLNYPEIYINNGTAPVLAHSDFTNYRVGGGIFGEYRFTSSFGINTTIEYAETISDTQIPANTAAPGAAAQVFDLNYRRFQAFIGARYFF
jgi:hypothetical protein